MAFEPVFLAIAGILASVAGSYLTTSPQFVVDQRTRAEWAAWGLLALSCWIRLRRRHPRALLSAVDNDDVPDKEAQLMTLRLPTQRRTTLLALLLVATQLVVVDIGRRAAQWIFSLIPLLALLIKTAFPNRSADQQPSPWPSRLFRNFESPQTALVFIGLSCLVPLGLVDRQMLQSLDDATIIMLVIFAASLAYAMVKLEAITPRDRDQIEGDTAAYHLELFASIATKAFFLCTLFLAAFSSSLPSLHILTVGFTGLRMLELYAVISLCFCHASISASSLLTCSAAIISTLNAGDWSSKGIFLLAAAVAVVLTRTTLPRNVRILWIYVLFVPCLVSWIVALYRTEVPHARTSMSFGPIHPVRRLFDANNATFTHMLESQSTTLEEAVAEYRRRYRRVPPPGFDRWFKAAQEADFQLIDEFDTIMETIEPFWGIPPSVLRARIDSAEKADSMTAVTVKDGAPSSEGHYYSMVIVQWLLDSPLTEILPDLKFLISSFDEPRVVAPYDALESAMKTAQQSRHPRPAIKHFPSQQNLPANNDVNWISIGKQATFEAMISSCHIDSPARSGLLASHSPPPLMPPSKPQLHPSPPNLPFVSNTTAALDVCASTNQLHHHGVLSAPDTMILTHSLVPIFSQCKPSVFSDILYPSPYYSMEMSMNSNTSTGDIHTDPSIDPPWSQKLDRLYWAGSSTGGYSTATNWRQMQRQRLTLMTQPDFTEPAMLLSRNKTTGLWYANTDASFADLERLFHLRITTLTQCDDAARAEMLDAFGEDTVITTTTTNPDTGAPEEQHETKRQLKHEDKLAALQSKYALDIDGNAYSGRFYRLLKSNSAVLKHTSFREWHDGRLLPWVHYFPVSSGAGELGELMRFLVEEEEGRELGEEVASRGRDWARRTLRREDLVLVMVRVLMEFGRVVGEGREGSGFGA